MKYKCISTEHYLAPHYEWEHLEKHGIDISGYSETVTESDSMVDAWNGIDGVTTCHGNCNVTPIDGWKHLYANGKLIREEG